MVHSHKIVEVKPPSGLDAFFHGKTPTLWGLGDAAILDRTLLGIISARQVDSDLALESTQLLKQLVSLTDVSFVGGWHSSLEEAALEVVSANGAPIVFCLSKGLDGFIPSIEVDNRISQGTALLLTHCSPKARRISRGASIRRNELIVGFAKVLLVLSAPEGSASLKLAESALRRGRPVLTPEHPMNKELLASGALPMTLENIRTALR
jgi:predicted Rossmann fold nucleotide-binding protein DprA/Smf involved in DNA uptake